MLLDTLKIRDHRSAVQTPSATREVVLRHLKNSSDIGTVQDLRGEIDLAIHAQTNPYFYLEEKKETKLEFPSLLNWMNG